MNSTLRKKTALFIASFAFALSACTGTNPPTTTDQGTEKASIFGTVTKEEGQPAKNATVVLIKKESGGDKDQDVVSTNSDGLYKFSSVPAGNYRVAFVIQPVSDRKNKTPQAFDPNFKTSEYFGAITTKNFDYDGNVNSSFQVPAFNVGWRANLNTEVSPGRVKFTWSAANGATGYNVLVKDVNDNPFFKSGTLTGIPTEYVWTDMKGNQGGNSGKVAEVGKTYYYIVNVLFETTSTNPSAVTLSYGNSTNGSFILQ
jgi:hypothetical protein